LAGLSEKGSPVLLSQLVETYVLHLESEGRSSKTLDWHRSCLRKFSLWLTESGTSENPDDWTAATIRAYLVSLMRMTKADGTPLSATSVNTYACSLRAFCHWLEVEEFAERNVMERVKSPALPKLVKPVLGSDECRALLKATKESRNALRDEAIILFLLDTGARANELCSLRETDIIWGQRLAKVFGKGSKERYIPFSAATMKAMQRYSLKARDANGNTFFQSEEGGKLSTSGLLQLCQRLGEKAEVEASPHKFRHTFAISYLRSGASVFALQKTLGHTSLEMSRRYASLMTEDLVTDHAKHSPVAALLGKGR
jgi:site-specific recombinase XerD